MAPTPLPVHEFPPDDDQDDWHNHMNINDAVNDSDGSDPLDVDENEQHGYHLLQQSNETEESSADIIQLDEVLLRSIGENTFVSNSADLYGSVTTVEDRQRADLWNTTRLTDSLPLDSNSIANIQDAMSKFALPSNNYPEWAKNIPEEQWKAQLLSSMRPSTDQR